MKKWIPLLLAMAMLWCLCACDNTPNTEKPPAAPTTQGQPDPTNPADPTDPPETASPVGVYGCTGLSTEGPDDYREVDYGELRVNADGTGDIYFDDYYHDFTWVMEEDRFLATTFDEPGISIEGTRKDGIMELVYDGNIYLLFRIKTIEEMDQEAVDYIRAGMEDTAQKMAVAYLGWFEGDEDFGVWLERNCPQMLEAYPFLARIPEERIVGEHGEVYCLVPKEHRAKVTISLLKEDGSLEDQQVLHRSENGAPLLLLCNYGGCYPDTEVLVQESTGEELRFYPQTGDTNAVVIPTNDSLENLMCDFTDYFEVLGDYYRAMLAQDWYFPDEEYLMSTCWNYQEDTPEDRCWILNLGGDTLQLDLSVDGVTAERYTGTWSLNYSDGTGLVYLWLDLLCSDGEQITVEYVVMKCPYDNGILLGIHEGQNGKPVLNGENQVCFWWGSVG